MKVDHEVHSEIVATPRVQQLSAMFDAPVGEKLSHHWSGDVPIEERDWNVGLIVGPSGAGKSTLARKMFGEPVSFEWPSRSVIDDFPRSMKVDQIAEVCSAVGFNTIPSWMKPFGVLSTGEKFRVELARAITTGGDPIVVDEFTSVVDRQVAHIGSHAVQKYVRKNGQRFVAVTCHFDVIDWLQPDWVLEPATMSFQWRSLRRRPAIEIEIARVGVEAWQLFAPYHYLTAELHRAAQCFCLFVNGQPASFAGVLHRPHAKVRDIKGVSRLVTLPDYQGLGLAMVLVDALGAAYRALDYRLHTYPAHPSLVRAFDRSTQWVMHKKPGAWANAVAPNSSLRDANGVQTKQGGRPCAVFEYVGTAAANLDEAKALLAA